MYGILRCFIFFTLLGLSSAAMAQDETKEENEKGFDWNLEIVGATFFGNDSYFGESESFIGANTDDWTESFAELGFTGYLPLGSGTFFAELSGLISATWGDDPSGLAPGEDTHHADWEQAHIGWRSGDTFSSLDKDALTLQAGNFDYLVGSGMVLADGTRDGGTRGGWWLSPRKAFRESFLATLKSGAWKIDGFYLQAEGRRDDARVYAYGGDLEYEFADAGLTTGLLYIEVPDQRIIDDEFREGYESLSLRGDWTATDNLSFGGEYAYQSRQSRPDTNPKGWFLKGAYKLNDTSWTPEFSYRYAHFDGDDLSTPGDEGFATTAYGFTDNGTWFQGEITGGLALDNSNLKSHMLRLRLFPNNDLVFNVIYYDFKLDQPHIFGDPVGSTDWGNEINLSVDYALGDRWFLNGVIGWLNPGEAATNWTGGDKTWVLGILYVSYSF